MVLTWTVAEDQSPDDVMESVQDAIGAHNFVNVFEVFGTHVISNVALNHTSDELLLLANELNAIASGRFTFVMYLVPKGNFALFSSDLEASAKTLDAIARF